MLGTPCYGAATSHLYSASLFRLAGSLAHTGIDLNLEMNGTSDVFTARNYMATQFLDRKHLTHLFFVDADLGFKPEQFVRLLVADKDVVCALYPLKQYNWPGRLPVGLTREEFEHLYTAYPFMPEENTTESDVDGFADARLATTGFMCIKRHVIEKMAEAYPDQRYYDVKPDGKVVGPLLRFFDPLMIGMNRYTEDYAFCKQWRDLGGKVFVDCTSKLDHMGQHIFRGDLAGSLTAKMQRAEAA